MSKFVRVETYPSTGFPERLWGPSPEGPGSPVHDAFLRSARPVVELYSEALVKLRLHGPRSTLRLSLAGPIDSDSDDVQVTVWRRQPEDLPEIGFIHLSGTASLLDATGRARLALDAVDAGVRTLASARDWDTDVFGSCRAHVEDSEFVYRWASPWKTSPDRRHQARATYRIGPPDGFGRARLEVRRRADSEVVATTDEAFAFCTSAGLQRSAKTLSWSDPGTIALTPYWGIDGRPGGALEARLDDQVWHTTARDEVIVRQPAGVDVEEDADAPVPRVLGTLA